ncbi:hypothetical protein [Saccharothrix deserti]|uniref:hypothetical protein n=1 Tax=Saccharothrix deserti TaxID=2593674 RepID=UPI00192E4CDD|nr:hypothetical protein [Saccharothrix deserti]
MSGRHARLPFGVVADLSPDSGRGRAGGRSTVGDRHEEIPDHVDATTGHPLTGTTTAGTATTGHVLTGRAEVSRP